MYSRVLRLSIVCVTLALVFALSPTTVSTATAQIEEWWHAEYFDNPTLSGAAACTRYDPYINWEWGLEGPADCAVGPDNFSVRWTREYEFDEGGYYFMAATDDGVRIYIDGQLLMDDWRVRQAGWTWVQTYLSGGAHEVRVEYFEAGGGAQARIEWQRILEDTEPPEGTQLTAGVSSVGPGAATTAMGVATGPGWHAEYYNNRYLRGGPVLIRTESEINYNWGYSSPEPGIVNRAYFSARWTQTVNFSPGEYIFTLQTDDGARLYIDDRLIVNAWFPQWLHFYTRRVQLEGSHTIRLEYFEVEEVAIAKLSWRLVGAPTPIEAAFTVDRSEITEGECVNISWDVQNARSAYYNGQWVNLTGTRRECPTTTQEYTLRAVQADGTEETFALTVTVTPTPSLIDFTVDRTQIAPGECVTLSWNAPNARTVYYQNQWVNPTGTRQECPTTTQDYVLRVIKTDGTEETRTVAVTVVDTTVQINFTADRTQINPGECVTISWNVQNIREVYYQGAGVIGVESRVECPTTTQTYTLRVVKVDGTEETRYLTITVGGGVSGGDVQVTLQWNSTANLDLYVTDPSSSVIYYGQPVVGNGRLERNANSPCNVATSSPIENIYWPTGTAPSGTYSVAINYTNQCYSEGVVTYTLTVRNNNIIIHTQTAAISPGQFLSLYSFTR